jgi:molybdopterin molybdotransferase
MTDDRRTAGFKRRTRLAAAREALLDVATPVDRTETVPLVAADARVAAESLAARRAVPHYTRAAMDGYAVRARDTFGASGRAPVTLRLTGEVGPGTAERVHTGSELPEGADAVVMVEHVDRVGDELRVADAVAEGENVGPVGEDVAAGADLFDPGHRLRPSDLGLLKAAGVDAVAVFDRPTVAVVPTGEELVQADPAPGEVVETNGLTVSRSVERWGGGATYRDAVADDRAALRAAIERDLDADAVVTTGGSSVGERDLVPDVLAELGEVLVHGVALRPGHPVALGVVDGTPVLALPGYPVSCVVNAVQFLRPLVEHLGHLPAADHPTTPARLTRKVASEAGVRTFVRVRVHRGDDGEPEAVPVRAGGAGVLSSVALADGWVTVPEPREGFDAGTRVEVEDWEWSA